MLKQKTWTARKEDLKGDWYVVDATGVPLGRLASSVARVLKGKHKPTYTPHLNTGDHVIVVNAARVRVTGAKMDGKVYTRYSGYPSGLRKRTLRQQKDLDPTFPVTNAVRGMLQNNTLGGQMLKRHRGPGRRDRARHLPSAARSRRGASPDPEEGRPPHARRAHEGAQEVRPEAGPQGAAVHEEVAGLQGRGPLPPRGGGRVGGPIE